MADLTFPEGIIIADMPEEHQAQSMIHYAVMQMAGEGFDTETRADLLRADATTIAEATTLIAQYFTIVEGE